MIQKMPPFWRLVKFVVFMFVFQISDRGKFARILFNLLTNLKSEPNLSGIWWKFPSLFSTKDDTFGNVRLNYGHKLIFVLIIGFLLNK